MMRQSCSYQPSVRRRALGWVVALIITLAGSGSALALDSQKRLTQYLQRNWGPTDGLPSSSALAILQDRTGYLWIGTQRGLARFDGISFTVFTRENTPELGSDFIYSLFQDREGSLWIGTRGGGVVQLRNGIFTKYTAEDGLVDDSVACITQTRDGSLWFGTVESGISRYRDGRFSSFDSTTGLPSNRIRAIREDANGTVWIGTADSGVFRYSESAGFTALNADEPLPSSQIRALHADAHGNLWIATADAGVIRYSTQGTLTSFSIDHGLHSRSVRSIYEDSDGNLWFGTAGGGISRLGGDRVSTYVDEQGVSELAEVFAITEDREGSLWIAAHNGGITQLRDPKFTSFTEREGLLSNAAFALAEDPSGGMWISTAKGLSRFRGGDFSIPKRTLVIEKPLALHVSRSGDLWAGTESGTLHRITPDRVITYDQQHGLPPSTILAIHEDRNGVLWLGTAGSGLIRYHDSEVTIFGKESGLGSSTVRFIHEDQSGTLWIATAGAGLVALSDGRFLRKDTDSGLPSDYVSSIHEDAAGVLWVATSGRGLVRFEEDRLTSYTSSIGLFDETIGQVLEDDSGRLWLSCAKGIFHVDKEELERFARGEIEGITSVSYGLSDGLRNTETVSGLQTSALRARDGTLWFATGIGVSMIDPGNLSINAVPTPVVLEKFVVDGRDEAVSGGATLLPGSRRFRFEFTGLSLASAENVRFQYRLEPFDSDWVDAGTRRIAYYTNLPPGRYHLRLKAANSDGAWTEMQRPFTFSLAPAFYQTNWFYALIIMLVASILLAAHRARVRYLQRRRQVLERMVDDKTLLLRSALEEITALKTKAELDALRTKLNPHFLFNTLNSIAALVRLDPSHAERLVTELSRLFRATLQISRRELVPLSEELGLIRTYLAIEKVRLGERLRFSIEIEPELLEHPVPGLLLQPLVENSIQHGIGPKIGGGHLAIRARREGEFCLLEVSDDGTGMAHREDRSGTGYGLSNVRDRLRLHYQNDGQIDIENDGGVRIVIRIPAPALPHPPTPPIRWNQLAAGGKP